MRSPAPLIVWMISVPGAPGMAARRRRVAWNSESSDTSRSFQAVLGVVPVIEELVPHPVLRAPRPPCSELDQDKSAWKLQVVGAAASGDSGFVLHPTPQVTGHGSSDAALQTRQGCCRVLVCRRSRAARRERKGESRMNPIMQGVMGVAQAIT